MASFTHSVFKCNLCRIEESSQAVELRLRTSSRTMCEPPSTTDLTHQICYGPPPEHPTSIPAMVVIPLPVPEHLLEVYLTGFLSSFYIPSPTLGEIARAVVSYVAETSTDDGRRLMRVVLDVDCVEIRWTAAEETTEIVPRPPPPPAAEEKEEKEEEICSICLDELNCGEWEPIEVACGHVYHDFCIYMSLEYSNSCPLCRAHLDLEY